MDDTERKRRIALVTQVLSGLTAAEALSVLREVAMHRAELLKGGVYRKAWMALHDKIAAVWAMALDAERAENAKQRIDE